MWLDVTFGETDKVHLKKDPKKHYFIRNKKICSADKDLSKLQKPAITNPSS